MELHVSGVTAAAARSAVATVWAAKPQQVALTITSIAAVLTITTILPFRSGRVGDWLSSDNLIYWHAILERPEDAIQQTGRTWENLFCNEAG